MDLLCQGSFTQKPIQVFFSPKYIHQASTQLIENEYIKTDAKLHQLFTSWSKAEDPETGKNVRFFQVSVNLTVIKTMVKIF